MNAEQLKRYYRDRAERLYRVRRGMLQDLEDEKLEYPKEVLSYPNMEWSNLLQRIRELENPYQSFDAPQWSNRQWDAVQQMKAELIHIRKEMAELQNKKAKEPVF